MKRSSLLINASMIIFLPFLAAACATFKTSEPSPESATEGTYFADDFSNPSTTWSTYNQPGAEIVIEEGVLRFRVDESYYDFWSTTGQNYTNVEVEVLAEKKDGPDNNNFGLICRYADAKNYYAFLISSDGYYGIMRVLDGEYKLLSSENMELSSAVNTGKSSNHLRVDCLGSQLVFYVNDQFLATVQDSQLSQGQTGVIVGTYDEAGVEIHFDDFIVQESQLIK